MEQEEQALCKMPPLAQNSSSCVSYGCIISRRFNKKPYQPPPKRRRSQYGKRTRRKYTL